MNPVIGKILDFLPGVILAFFAFLGKWLHDRNAIETERLRVRDEATAERVRVSERTQKADAEALESSWHSWASARQYLDQNFKELSEQRDRQNQALLEQIRTLQKQVISLEEEVARLSKIEEHSQELDSENRTLRERLRVLGEVA